MKKSALLIGLFALVVGQVASAAHWHNVAKKHADHFLETFEVVDEEFHEYNVPAKVIEVTHHVEEVAVALVDDITSMTLRQAKNESNHIANDMNEIFPILKRHGYFNNHSLNDAWNHMARAHLYLSNYLWSIRGNWNRIEKLEVITIEQ